MVYTLLPGIVNPVRLCYISSILLYFYWDFHWQQTLFLWQRNFYWLFEIKSFCKIIFGSVSVTSVELENSVHWQSLVIFPFVSSIALLSSRKKWLSYLSHAINPYLHRKLTNWTNAFYLSFCCTVWPRILNILIFINRVISIICVCQLYFMLFHV